MKKTGKHDWRRVGALTDAEVHAAALRDPDARSPSDEGFRNTRKVRGPRRCAGRSD